MNDKLTTIQLCRRLGVARHAIERMVADGAPVAGKSKPTHKGGRPGWLFDVDQFAQWALAAGRNLPGITGEAIKTAIVDSKSAPAAPAPAAPAPDTEKEPIMLQVKAERHQYQKLFARFLRINTGDDAAGVAALAKAITLKSDSLRRLELSALEYQQQTGELVRLAETRRLFSELAGGVQQRMLALPNELAPILREYLRDPDDAGRVRDEIDQAIRHGLSVLPDDLPEIGGKN